MEHQLWKAIVAVLATLDKPRTATRFTFSDEAIVKVYYWSVICDRPTSWACQKANWPLHLRKPPLPSPSAMSRRLRSASVVVLLDALERRVTTPKEPGLFWMIDGKPLPIGGCSKDRQAGYGRSAGSKDRVRTAVLGSRRQPCPDYENNELYSPRIPITWILGGER